MTQHESSEAIDSRIHAFLAKKPVQNKLSVDVANWFHGKFGDRKASVQSHQQEPVTWARYER